MFDIHAQTLRLYEREGLLSPHRTEGNTRLYSEEDVERLEQILQLSRDLGVNLAGIDFILRLQERQSAFEKEVLQLLAEFVGHVEGIDGTLSEELKHRVHLFVENNPSLQQHITTTNEPAHDPEDND